MEFLDVYQRYKPELAQVEAILANAVQSKNAAVTKSSLHLLEAGGKRIRPLFALVCGQYGGQNRDKVYTLAAAMELVHMASLVHDDVIDDASVRRGHPTVRAEFGDRPAMYVGDYLFAKAIQLLCTVSSAEVHTRLSTAIVKMVEGEIDQIEDFYNTGQTFVRYFRRIQRKTALLHEMSCGLGALVGGADRAAVRAMGRFGRFTGMAFQIIDDVLDFVGDERLVGKRVGGDLRQGNLTLPVLYTMKCTKFGAQVQSLISNQMTEEAVDRVLATVRETNAIAYARQVAERYMKKAVQAISGIQHAEVYDELMVIGEFVNQRAF
jgi:heptaprenyl diphosphate synthase